MAPDQPPDPEEQERDTLTDADGPEGVRLQKVLAAAGVGSRRRCEELIGEGRVEVDGQVVRRFGARVDPDRQVIRVDGRRIPARQGLVYLALNKPAGVLSAMSDDRGRPTLADLLPGASRGPAARRGSGAGEGPGGAGEGSGGAGESPGGAGESPGGAGEGPGGAERLFHVGRLDFDTEGLILLTNDGELAHRLAHPRYGVLKTYLADVAGPVPSGLGRRLAEGIQLEDGVASADRFRVVDRAGSRALVEITLHEGRKHIVRRMLAEAGHPVSRLVRTQLGPVKLGSLAPGTTRELTAAEVGELYAAVGM